MADSISPFQVTGVSVEEINDVLRQITEKFNELQGLQGAAKVYGDGIEVKDGAKVKVIDKNGVTIHSLGSL